MHPSYPRGLFYQMLARLSKLSHGSWQARESTYLEIYLLIVIPVTANGGLRFGRAGRLA